MPFLRYLAVDSMHAVSSANEPTIGGFYIGDLGDKSKSNYFGRLASTTVSLGMAEVLLNTLWLGVSATALSIWLFRPRTARVRAAQALIALACIAVLLFPVVSATDDLCAVTFAAEDTSVVKKLNEPSRVTGGLHTGGVAALFHFRFSVVPDWRTVGALDVDEENVISSPQLEAVQGRAPPLS